MLNSSPCSLFHLISYSYSPRTPLLVLLHSVVYSPTLCHHSYSIRVVAVTLRWSQIVLLVSVFTMLVAQICCSISQMMSLQYVMQSTLGDLLAFYKLFQGITFLPAFLFGNFHEIMMCIFPYEIYMYYNVHVLSCSSIKLPRGKAILVQR